MNKESKEKTEPSVEDWILAEAESYQEKLQLAHNTILVFQSMGWYHRLFKSKKLFRSYTSQLHQLDRAHLQNSEKMRKQIESAASAVMKSLK